ncbi:MAG TPA: ABC transporter ATP-binding protein [Burkholderiales bacterium]|nr:ABC transporter ATP-binding protein [Burkholderiales bacterium]
MARLRLEGVRHSYRAQPAQDADWALKDVDLEFEDGGAYALLGPSGCGKTTLLNLVSGLLHPTQGRVRFGDADVTELPTDRRNIAQVFQFPVVYDTMTVFDNLAFPLRNRGMAPDAVRSRVQEVAALLDLEGMLGQRAAGLTADGKQKISLGRGLARPDVNVLMLDEPLTVIDPHLKWRLRSKLKELHQRVALTMIYVTHDQTEAMTFADRVVVMHEGAVVQVGTPVDLFERPRHTFVGHFIGSPGMNVMPCQVDGGVARLGGRAVPTANRPDASLAGRRTDLGVRPEFVRFADDGIPVRVARVSDAGRHQIVEAHHGDQVIRLLLREGESVPAGAAHVAFDPAYTHLYADGWICEARA